MVVEKERKQKHKTEPSSPSFSAHSSFPVLIPSHRRVNEQNDDVDVSDDFEFSSVSRHTDSSPVSADDIFFNGQIIPIYPPFHQNDAFVADASVTTQTAPLGARRRRLPLRTLMFEEEERETVNIDSSNELHGVAEGTYCVWTPPCKKTTASSTKRWKIRDLLLPRRHSKVAPKHSSAAVNGGAIAKLVGFFTNANGLARNLQPFSS
ncbi:hypothetical protein JHK85_012037 [Glycine max]|uniref:Uncharacterized protein n=1 Tax=Glycine soja TaxID=3848 RepID=A0A445KIT3_GLYSO|nr:hypothetical protein JHK85_012037 [Glycine max]KAG5056708.1 hypothetical protein JHK86_011704 [Glycine max]RZC10841.1 hypothetical protein D0Y65_011200 [Glycine soja]